MAGDLAGVDLKVGRAKRKLADLDKCIKAAFAPDRYRISSEFDSEIAEQVYSVHDLPAIDPEWALEIAEVLYQLRSALDHLAWQLVELDGNSPNEQTQFPIRDSPNDKNEKRLPLQNLLPQVKNPDILNLIDECQPYNAGDGTDYPVQKARTTPLWHLKALNNVDKHRLLLVVVSAVDFDNMWWGWHDDNPPSYRLNFEPLTEGDPVAWFDFGGPPAPEHFDPHPAVRVTLRDPEAPALWLHPLVGVIENLVWWVEWQVVNLRFRPLFS
jgi:hypothetical protein